MKKILSLALAALLTVSLTACSGSADSVVNVYNWGEYIDSDLLRQFEDETGIRVVYNTFETNEGLYSRLKSESYDVVIPSDYMIARMIDENMLQKLNFDNIPNYALIDSQYTGREFDPNQEYSVPYTWGAVGIIYNTKKVDAADTGSWDILWNPQYAGQTAMFDNSRDAMGVALKLLGYSQNTTNKEELRAAADKIIEGKDNFQGFWMDQILEKHPNEEILTAPYYNGDAVTMMEDNPDLSFYIPEEGTNVFIDAMCIPANAKNVENAEKFINFMCSTEAAAANADYIGYSSPQREVYEQQDDSIKNDPIHYPSAETVANGDIFLNLPEDINEYYNELWTEILR